LYITDVARAGLLEPLEARIHLDTAHASALAASLGSVTTGTYRCGHLVVEGELDALGVDEDQSHLGRGRTHQYRW
jgi:hypothetical protein